MESIMPVYGRVIRMTAMIFLKSSSETGNGTFSVSGAPGAGSILGTLTVWGPHPNFFSRWDACMKSESTSNL